MKKRLVIAVLGKFLIIEAFLLLIPTLCSLIYKEYDNVLSFLITAAISAAVGTLFCVLMPKNSEIYAKEGLMIIGLVWLSWSAIGALPFYLCGDIPRYVDCFFETVSGFTTTGATILTDIESVSKGMHFWRSFTHWIGGMGVLVFAMAIIPLSEKNSLRLMRAEVPGPVVSKLVPRGMRNAKILYGIYIALCVLQFCFLRLGGMPVYDCFINTFSTAGTGGFNCRNASIAAYNSPYIEWVITVFMFLFSINFNIYYFIIVRKLGAVWKNSEWKVFTAVVLAATLFLTLSTRSQFQTLGDTVRSAAFNTVSLISTTGFCTVDFNVWGGFAKIIILALMFIGACAGSTGGGLKISRVMIMFKSAVKNVREIFSPHSVNNIKIDGKLVESDTVNATTGYILIYVMVFAVSVLLVALNNLSVEETVSAVTTCFNNVGPGFGSLGPSGNFSAISDFSKIVLSVDMLLGRLELFPILLLLVPSVWRKKFV